MYRKGLQTPGIQVLFCGRVSHSSFTISMMGGSVMCKNENMCRKLGTAINEGYMLNVTNMEYAGVTN